VAASFRGYGWAGAAPGTKQLYLWGGTVGNVPGWKRAKQALYDRLYRRRVLDCFHYGPDRAGDFVAAVERFRPHVIVAYTNPLYEFARALGAMRFSPTLRARSSSAPRSCTAFSGSALSACSARPCSRPMGPASSC